jgi:hypothetical protein
MQNLTEATRELRKNLKILIELGSVEAASAISSAVDLC